MRAEQLIEAMERRLRGEAVGIGPFARLASPPAFDAEGLGKLGRFARREADGLLTLLDDPDPGARHAAAYLLGRSADARAVDPLFALTVAPQDWLDPDYAIEALGALGDVALPGLLTRALVGSDAEAALAVRAMGCSRGDALACLERVRAERRPLPEGLFLAYETLGDPLGLPAAMHGLDDPATRDEALGAAEELLVSGAASRFEAQDRVGWAERFTALLGSGDVNERARALVCLGRLGAIDRWDAVHAALDDADDDVAAAAASALVSLDRGRATDALVSALDDRRLAHRATFAATLLDKDLARGRDKRRAAEIIASAAYRLEDGWAHERAVLVMERQRAARAALIEAMPTLPPKHQAAGAEALVAVTRLRKRPAASYARLRDKLSGAAREALEAAWRRAMDEEARLERQLAEIRERPPASSRPRSPGGAP